MKLIPNTDPYTSRYAKEGWASFGFDYLSTFDSDNEEDQPFGNPQFNYSR
jgi:hypothetical protein